MVFVPQIQFVLQDSNIDPSGHRHESDPTYGFVKNLTTGAGGVLDLGSINITNSGGISDTKLIYFRVSDFGDASGIYNMRFFVSSTEDWGLGTYRFLERKSLHFPGPILLSLDDNQTPTTAPQFQNISGTTSFPEFQGGKPWLSGVLDADASMYIALAAYANTDVPIGLKGGDGSSGYKFKMMFDFS